MNYAEKSPIKKELEQCMNNGPNYNTFGGSGIKEENEQSETISLLEKSCEKTNDKIVVEVEYNEDKMYCPYQCAVCCQRYAFLLVNLT